MIYEMRTYQCVHGRLPALLKRFETSILPLWTKHGIRQAGFWTVAIGDSGHKMIFMIAWESLAEREQKWATFQADPELSRSRGDSEQDGGPILAHTSNVILTPTKFSAVQ